MSNQYLRSDVLFHKRVDGFITELSFRGDRLAVYTEDNGIFQKLKPWRQLLYAVPYFQGKKQVAADLYFPKQAKKDLLRTLRKLTEDSSQSSVSQLHQNSPGQK